MTYDIDAVRQAYLSVPDEAVFLERAKILHETGERYADLTPGLRQGKIFEELCEGITPVVSPNDVSLARVLDQMPDSEDETFLRKQWEFLVGTGGYLDTASIYLPDWEKLLRFGIGGLIEEVEQTEQEISDRDQNAQVRQDYLEGVRVSLLAASRLIGRYAQEARRLASNADDPRAARQLLAAAECCEKIAILPPETFREALQLFLIFHMMLSCLIGGRDVAPGRMDQYLFPFYQRDLANGEITRSEAVELIAITMIGILQMSGNIATDFQSVKRSPNRYSHYYITLAGIGPDGESAVNGLSFAFLEAIRLVRHREPSLVIRYFKNIDREFWREAVKCMRDGLPILTYNDQAVIPALLRCGVAEELARNYAHSACMNCAIPGYGFAGLANHHNAPRYLLLAINGGKDPLTSERSGPTTPAPEELETFDEFFAAFRVQMSAGLESALASTVDIAHRYPLLVWPLFHRHLETQDQYWEHETKYFDQYISGIATTVDSLLAIQKVVYHDRKLSMDELAAILKDNFRGRESFRQYLLTHVPSYGSDDREVTEMIEKVGEMWVEELRQAEGSWNRIRLRPGFYSWLYNMEMGKSCGATPDGRLSGQPLSSDQLPSPGKRRAPTEMLNSLAHLPHDHTCSGGTTFPLEASYFKGGRGIDRLSALIEAYFGQKGLQLHFVFADVETLRDAVKHPERHQDLLVRLAGFSEYFVRLLPEVQEQVIRRFERS